MSEEAILRAINDLQARNANVLETFKKIGEVLKKNDEKLDRADESKEKQNKILAELKIAIDKATALAQASHTHLSNEIDRLERGNVHLAGWITGVGETINQNEKNLEKLQQNCDSFKEHISNGLAMHLFDLGKELRGYIDTLPKPQIPSSEEIQAAIHLALQPVAIDAKNGCLRSSNCDMRIGIAEKKIDQIFLLLQKHSLNQ